MRRTVIGIFILLLLTLLAPYRAGALGLGDIKLSSYLNQPLKARIGLLPAQAGELDDAKITLAPNDAFERAGIERRDVLDQLKFQVAKGADGRPFIQVTSQDPIKEPFLDFILQVTWPKGRLLREYTVLLDPPVTTQESAPPIQPAESTATTAPAETPVQAAAPAAEADTGSAAAAPEAAPAPAGVPTRSIDAKLTKDSYGPTQRTDTLWSIAKAVRPDRSVSIQQVMLALVKNNRDAFYNGNVNTLKAGYVLRLPDLALINQVDQADALREVKRQYQQWQDIKAGKTPATATATPGTTAPSNQAASAGGTTAPAPAKTDEQARLKLLPPDAGQAAAGVTGGTAAAGTSTQDRLASALEANEAQKQENASLRARIDELNEQVQSMKRLLSLKDDTLAVLQNKLGETQQGAAAAQAVTPQSPAATSSQATQTKPAPAAKPAAPSHPTVVKPPAHAAPKPQPHQGGGLLTDPKVLGMGGAVVLLVGTLGWLAMRRRKMKIEAEVPEAGEALKAAADAAEATTDDEEKTVETGAYSPTGGDLLEAEVNEIDPLAEADVYMAYRRYQQAEELLKGAIDQEPNRQELRLKLLEVYAAAENTDSFSAEAESFYNQFDGRDNPLWQKVASMGRDVAPTHPLFSSDGDDPGVDTTMAQAHEADTAVADVSGDLSDFSVDVEPLAMDDVAETTVSDDEQTPAQEADTTEEELTFLAAEQTEDSLDLDARQPVADDVAESDDSVQGEAEQELTEENKDLTLEFEPGLDKVLPERASDPKDEDETETFKTGNEIDFDAMAVADDNDEGQEQTVEAGADESLDDGLDDSFELDTVGGLDNVDAARPDTDSELTFVEDNKDNGPKAVVGDGTGEPAEPSAVEQEDDQDGGKLDFDFDLGSSLATKDKDLDDFFEGLDSGDEDQDGSGGHEEVGTKLDLAKAFIEMGDQDGAKDILREVVDNGDDEQKQEAQGLLQQLDA